MGLEISKQYSSYRVHALDTIVEYGLLLFLAIDQVLQFYDTSKF